MPGGLPLTKRAQKLDFVSFGLAILSHKGRGKARSAAPPQVQAGIAAPYLSPCGRGYVGPVRAANRWPKLVRGNLLQITPNSLPTSANTEITFSTSARECAADICVRMRACPLGTTGKANPIT
jgi:hypothetical protein